MKNTTSTKAQISTLSTLSQGAAAHLVGLSTRTLRDSDAPRNSDGSYSGRDLLSWFAHQASGDVTLGAPTDSPGLERYRMARAKMAELDLAIRRGELIEVAAWRELMARWANRLRRCGDMLARKFGNDALAVQTDAIADMNTITDTFLTELEHKGKAAK